MDYRKVYESLILKRSKVTPLGYSETHHVIPKCLGGSDTQENLVSMTAREHFVAHVLLMKIFPEVPGLARSIFLFRTDARGVKINSRIFELARETAAKDMSRRSRAMWSDPEIRDSILSGIRTYSSGPERSRVSSFTMNRLWSNPEFSSLHKERVSRLFESEEVRSKHRNSRKKFLEANPKPWMRPRAQPTRVLWSLADLFWFRTKFNPKAVIDMGAVSFCREFNEGLNIPFYENMKGMFKTGWVPKDDEVWVREFGHYFGLEN